MARPQPCVSWCSACSRGQRISGGSQGPHLTKWAGVQRGERACLRTQDRMLWALALIAGQGAPSQIVPTVLAGSSCVAHRVGGFVGAGLGFPNFAISYPLQLLIPHIRYTLHINTLARELLIAPGKVVDRVSTPFGGRAFFNWKNIEF